MNFGKRKEEKDLMRGRKRETEGRGEEEGGEDNWKRES